MVFLCRKSSCRFLQTPRTSAKSSSNDGNFDHGWWMMDDGFLHCDHKNRDTHRHTFNQMQSSTFVPEWTWYEDSITLDQKHGLSWYDFQFSDRESWIINQLEATLYWWVCRLGFDDGDAEWCHMFPLFSWKEARSGYRNLMDLRKTLTFLRGESFRKSSSTSSWWHSYTYIICYDVRFRYFPFQME